MVIVESDCCDCGLPCIYDSCKYYKVIRYVCDNCEDETDIYEFDGQELCIDCIEKLLTKIERNE